MLILTRRTGETIRIGEDITVTLLSFKGNQVSIGIEAPKEMRVDRDEVRRRIMREQVAKA